MLRPGSPQPGDSVTDYAAGQGSLTRRLPSFAIVALLHIAIGYALVTGLARKVVEVVNAPIEAKIIEEVKPPPPDVPPPPPPKMAVPPPPFIPPPEINIQVPQVTPPPTITMVTTAPPPPGPPPVIAPPAPPAPVVRKEFKAAYRVNPVFPRRAIDRGISGRVLAWLHVTPSGQVARVEIRQSSNPIFEQEVVRALSQWRFKPEPVGFIGEYAISFDLQD
jgi:periplasmic protein TonB